LLTPRFGEDQRPLWETRGAFFFGLGTGNEMDDDGNGAVLNASHGTKRQSLANTPENE
jgi:hypothetical protein